MDQLIRLYQLLSKRRRRQLTATLALMFCGVVAEAVTVSTILPFLAIATEGKQSRFSQFVSSATEFIHPDQILAVAILLACATALSAIIRLALASASLKLVMSVGHDIAAAIFRNTIRDLSDAPRDLSSSDILSRVEKVQPVVFAFLLPMMQAVVASVIAAFLIGVLLLLDPVVTVIGAGVVISIYVLVGQLTQSSLTENSTVMSASVTQRIRVIQDVAGGSTDIILGGTQERYEGEFRRVDRAHRLAHARNILIATAPRQLVEAAAIMTLLGVVLYVRSRDGELMTALPVIASLAVGAQRLLPLLQQAWSGWSHAKGNFRLLADVMQDLRRSEEAYRVEGTSLFSFRNEISLKNVGFAYDCAHPVIEGVTFSIRRGELLGIRGSTGGGKTTLLQLLAGLMLPTEGEIRIDGVQITRETHRAWQGHVAYVHQNIYLSDTTVAANVTFGTACELDMERLWEAVKVAHLDVFVGSQAAGLHTRVGEMGSRLSSGQRQRLGIARAIYKNPSLLLLDEATNALDRRMETRVIRSIREWCPELTIVLVAHRESALQLCDRVLDLDKLQRGSARGRQGWH